MFYLQQAGEETEERQNLARKAADAIRAEDELVDGDVIEKYNRGISHVENILNLHKLRQKVLLEEKLAASGRSSKSLRKFASTPNLAHITSAVSCALSCPFIFHSVCIAAEVCVFYNENVQEP